MKKIILVLLLSLAVTAFTACGKSEAENEENTGNTPTEEVTPTIEATPTAEADPTDTPVPTEEVTPTLDPAPTGDPATDYIGTPIDGTVQIGVKENEKVMLNDVLLTYYEYLSEYMSESEYADFDTTRYGLAFIDGDRIPELLIADNDNHGTGVRVVDS